MTGMTDDWDPDLDLDLDPDLDWARDLFDRARGAGEPAWTADSPTLARAGDRRRRIRRVAAAGGLAGVVALTTAVAVGLGAGTTDLGSQPGPGGAWANRPLSDVFKYSTYFGAVDHSGKAYVPAPAVADLAVVIARVDPSLTHLVGQENNAPRIVPADDDRAEKNKSVYLNSVWVDDSPRQAGFLTFGFAAPGGWAETSGGDSQLDTGKLSAPCDIPLGHDTPAPGTTPVGNSLPPTDWSPCAVVHLADGSLVAGSSARVGEGTDIVALRQFADGEIFTVIAEDYGLSELWKSGVPDPETVVHPTPWSEQSLVAALADPSVRAGWNRVPPPDADARLLQPVDFGKSWGIDADQPGAGPTWQLALTNGCGPVVGLPAVKPGVDAHYWGPLPDGTSGTAYEAEYPLIPGTGVKTMTTARSEAQGGCKSGLVDYSKDTLIPLPPGIGDDAFAAAVPALGTVSVDVRVGDTILRTDLSNVDRARTQSWTDTKPLDLTSPADRQWLAAIALAMVARHTGAGHP